MPKTNKRTLKEVTEMLHGKIPADIVAFGQVLVESIQVFPEGRYEITVKSDEHIEIEMRVGADSPLEVSLMLGGNGEWFVTGTNGVF